MQKHPKVLLIILDGWGNYKSYKGNAIANANLPFYQSLLKNSSVGQLHCSGEWVGLPDGQMGTSEVNHMSIGSGRVLFQDLVRINKDIREGTFSKNAAFIEAFEHVKKHNSTLHLKGLLSPGGVHSHQEHLFELLKAAKEYGITKVFIHMFTDGRDVLPKSAKKYIEDLEQKINEIGIGKIATIAGRYYAMDRDHNWDRTDLTFSVLTQNTYDGKVYKSAHEALEDAYNRGVTDEFIEPARIEVGQGEVGSIASNDAVIFINFRNDRTRQMVERFLQKGPKNLKYVTMTNYHPDYPVSVAYPLQDIKKTLGEVLSTNGIRQLRVTETEKFAHLTFFFNCKREETFEGEDRMMFDSYSDVKTHDEKPYMRTRDIAEFMVKELSSETYEFMLTNWCNGDMVGHTGNIPAAIEGCEVIDESLSKVIPIAIEHGYTVLITADHGNCEQMIDEDSGEMLTSHTLNPVPLILISKDKKELKTSEASVVDIAPTILDIMNIEKPNEMTGKSLI